MCSHSIPVSSASRFGSLRTHQSSLARARSDHIMLIQFSIDVSPRTAHLHVRLTASTQIPRSTADYAGVRSRTTPSASCAREATSTLTTSDNSSIWSNAIAPRSVWLASFASSRTMPSRTAMLARDLRALCSSSDKASIPRLSSTSTRCRTGPRQNRPSNAGNSTRVARTKPTKSFRSATNSCAPKWTFLRYTNTHTLDIG